MGWNFGRYDEQAAETRWADGVMANRGYKAGSPKKTGRLLSFLGRSALTLVIFSVLLILCLRWLPPPTSAVMLERHFERIFHEKRLPAVRYRWIDRKRISPYLPLAVIASEDQKFPSHWGFDLEAISDAVEDRLSGGRLRGASTITQQVAKNQFLWSGRSFIRKGLEAYFTVLLELLWPKARIMEVYLNIAEFGDGIYGVQAASKALLGKSPARIDRDEAALLAAVLPNPRRMSVRNPSPYVTQRAEWIRKQMERLGGIEYFSWRRGY